MKRAFTSLLIVIFFMTIASLPVMAQVQEIPVTTSSAKALEIFKKGQYLVDVGRPQEATTVLQGAVAADPTFSYAYLTLAFASASTEEFKDDLDLAMKNIAGKSEGEKALIEINQTFLTNDAVKRINLSKELVQEYPSSPRAWLNLGFMQASLNEHTAARESFQKALALDQKLVLTHFALGFSYLFNEPRDLNKAEKYMLGAIDLNKKEAKGYENLGDVYRAKNELEKARDSYTKAVEVDSTLGVAVLKKGHINSFLGHYEEARKDYDSSLSTAKDANKIFYANFKTFTNIYAGNPAVAIQELNQLAAAADTMNVPKDQLAGAKVATLTNAEIAALHTNMLTDAEKTLALLKTATAENNQGVGDADFARQQNAGLLLFDSELAARKGDYKTAAAKAEESKKMVEQDQNPRKFEGYYRMLGLIELLQKNYAKAVEYYKKSDQTNIYYKYQYALALEGAGNRTEAQKLFRQAGTWNFNTVGFALVRKDALSKAS
jgi:tetratricopeptide (TPR) repeat protein